MMFFNSTSTARLFLSGGILILLSACSFRGASKPGAPQSEISVRTLSLISPPQTTRSNAYGLPVEKVFRIETCLKDTPTDTNARGLTFELRRGKHLESITADANGCVEIDLTTNFDPLAPNNFITTEDRLTYNSADVALKYAYNPWVETGAALIDLNRTKNPPPNLVDGPHAQEALLGAKPFNPEQFLKDRPSNLSISKVEGYLHNTPASNSGVPQRKIELHLSGKLLRPGADRKLEPFTPREGKERVKVVIVKTRGDKTESSIPLTPIETAEGTWNQGTLDVELPLEFTNRPEDKSDVVKLVYMIWPATPLERHLPSAGEVTVELESGKISSSPTELFSGDIRDYFGLPLERAQKGTLENKGFVITDYNLVREDDSRTVEPNFWSATERAKLSISVEESLSRRALNRKEFELEFRLVPDQPGLKQRVRTDDKGNISAQVDVSFPLAGKSHYLPRWIVLRSLEKDFPTQSEPIEISVNPWKKGTAFFWDNARWGSPKVQITSDPVELDIQKFNYTFLGRSKGLRFHVSRNLEFTQYRHYHFYLSPNLRRVESVEDKGEIKKAEFTEPLPADVRIFGVGAFLIGALDEIPDLDSDEFNKRIISGFRTVAAPSRSGQVVLDVFLPVAFKDLTHVEGRTTLALEIGADGTGILPDRQRFLISFKSELPDNDVSMSIIPEFDRTVQTQNLETQLKTAKSLEEQSLNGTMVYRKKSRAGAAKDLFLSYWKNYTAVSTVQLADEKNEATWDNWDKERNIKTSAGFRTLVEERLKMSASEAIKAPTAILAEFCKDLDLKSAPSHHCTSNPLQFFNLNTLQLVNDVTDPDPKPIKAKGMTLKQTGNFFRELQHTRKYSEGNRNAASVTGGMQSSLGYEHFGNGVKFTTAVQASHDTYSMEEVSNQEGLRTRLGVAEELSIHNDEFRLAMTANAQHCLFIRPLTVTRDLYSLNSYLICAPVKPQTLTESWYYTRDRTVSTSSTLNDAKDPVLRGWSIVHRGTPFFKDWWNYVFSGKVAGFRFDRVQPFTDGVESFFDMDFGNVLARLEVRGDGGIFPGVTDYYESTTQKWSEPQIWGLTEKCGEATKSPTTYRACRCVYEAAALEWSFDEFQENSKDKLEILKRNDTVNRCKQVARKQSGKI